MQTDDTTTNPTANDSHDTDEGFAAPLIDFASLISMATGATGVLAWRRDGELKAIARAAHEVLNLVQLALERRGEDPNYALMEACGWGSGESPDGKHEPYRFPVPQLDRSTALSVAYWAAESMGNDTSESARAQETARGARDAIARLLVELERRREYGDPDLAKRLGWGGPEDSTGGQEVARA